MDWNVMMQRICGRQTVALCLAACLGTVPVVAANWTPAALADQSGDAATAVAAAEIQEGDFVTFGPYIWCVQETNDDAALLALRGFSSMEPYAVSMPYVAEWSPEASWELSDIRAYLNGEFLDEFTAEERGSIVETANGAGDADLVFVPSVDEILGWYGDSLQVESAMQDNPNRTALWLRTPPAIATAAQRWSTRILKRWFSMRMAAMWTTRPISCR